MRVGLIGCGGMGGVHANKYAQIPDVSVSVFDLDSEKLSAFCAARSLESAVSLSTLLEGCDVADVCLPTTAHESVALECLRAGKPTLVEKPFARHVEECERMVAEADRLGVLLVPAHVVRFFPEHRKAHDLIVAGEIGDPASVRLRRGGGPPKMPWFLDIEKSGGILLDLAVHEFDWLLWTLGPATLVSSRSALVSGAAESGDYALTTVTFSSGCVAHVESTWMDPGGFRVTIEAAGSDGCIEFDSRVNPTIRAGAATENNYAAGDDPYFQQLTAFLDSAAGRRPPAVTAKEGLEAVRLACAAIESAKTGQIVAF